MPVLLRGLMQPLREGEDDRTLVGRGEIGPAIGEPVLAQIAHRVEQRGLDAREREVETGDAGNGEPESLGIALAGKRIDLGPTRIRQAEQSGALVERLARGVVERGAETIERAALVNGQEQGVPPARKEADERCLDGRLPRYKDAT